MGKRKPSRKPKSKGKRKARKLLRLLEDADARAQAEWVADRHEEEMRSMLKTLEAIQTMQSADAEPADGKEEEGGDRWAEFSTWLSEKGGISLEEAGLRIGDAGDAGSGLFATRAFASGEQFVTVPARLMISTETALADSALGPLIRNSKFLQSAPSVTLALHLAAESSRGEASYWAPYLATLPATYNTVLYYTADELLMLSGSPAYPRALAVLCTTVHEYVLLYKLLLKTDGVMAPEQFTWSKFAWAMSAAMTRQNRVPVKSVNENALALVPLWDMCNHAEGDMTTGYDMETDMLTSSTMTAVEEGEQLTIYYGNRSNADLLLFSGFTVVGNKCDKMEMRWPILSASDPLMVFKRKLVKNWLPSTELREDGSAVVKLQADGSPSPETMTMLRISCLDKAEALALMREGVPTPGSPEAAAGLQLRSARSEFATMSRLKDGIAVCQERYAIKDAAARLDSGEELSFRQRCMLQLLAGEQMILASSTAAIETLQSALSEAAADVSGAEGKEEEEEAKEDAKVADE
eukprot:PLAT4031.1.p1 GENE.PLAT4031.1~~PLAT4031.1.p1  ORF type:complete len:523 (-),score=203.98 PLAT4031.1:34-1602(-)